MKKILLVAPFFFAILVPFGCKLPPVTMPFATPTPTSIPAVPPTATPTLAPATPTPTATVPSTSTPSATPSPIAPIPTIDPNAVCGFTVVTVPTNTTPTNLSALEVPIVNVSNLPTANCLVIRSFADWQNWCGTATPPAPPVDFSQQMLVETFLSSGCLGHSTLDNVCVGPSQVILYKTFHPAAQSFCWAQAQIPIWVAIPQNNLPIAIYSSN
ncbi:MAG TPA: hypothetical protein VHE12_00145 [bacterium]|nr:hypothetical protein [bacterium]